MLMLGLFHTIVHSHHHTLLVLCGRATAVKMLAGKIKPQIGRGLLLKPHCVVTEPGLGLSLIKHHGVAAAADGIVDASAMIACEIDVRSVLYFIGCACAQSQPNAAHFAHLLARLITGCVQRVQREISQGRYHFAVFDDEMTEAARILINLREIVGIRGKRQIIPMYGTVSELLLRVPKCFSTQQCIDHGNLIGVFQSGADLGAAGVGGGATGTTGCACD